MFHTIFGTNEVTFLFFPEKLIIKFLIIRFFTSVAYCSLAYYHFLQYFVFIEYEFSKTDSRNSTQGMETKTIAALVLSTIYEQRGRQAVGVGSCCTPAVSCRASLCVNTPTPICMKSSPNFSTTRSGRCCFARCFVVTITRPLSSCIINH